MPALTYVLGMVASVLQLVGVSLALLDSKVDRRDSTELLGPQGEEPNFLSYGIRNDLEGYERDKAAAALVGLKKRLSERLEGGLGRRLLGAWLVIGGILLDMSALTVAFA